MAPASAWVSGTVVSPEYAPVPGARITYLRPTEFGAMMARAMGRVAEVAASADGYFEMHGLEVGPSSLRVEAEGFAPLEFDVEAPAVQWIDAGFVELSRGRRITVRSDVEGGAVKLDPGAEHDPLGPMTGKVADGEALFENVPDEEALRVRVLDEGVPVCERREEAGTGDEVIRCDRSTVTVTGLVTVAGQPGNGRLIWHSKVANPQPEGIMRTLGGSVQRTQVVSSKIELAAPIDQEGRYRLDSMLPGEWKVILWSDTGGMQDQREVTVPDAPGEETVVDFHYGGVSIDGIVVDAEGQPVTHATVDVFPGRQAVVTGQNGRYEIRDLAPGAYQLRARYRHQRSDLMDVELRDYDDRQSVRLELLDNPRTDELVIRLTGGSGGFCFVAMEASSQQVTRVDGGVATVKLPPPLTDPRPRRLPGGRTLGPHRLAAPRTRPGARRRPRSLRVRAPRSSWKATPRRRRCRSPAPVAGISARSASGSAVRRRSRSARRSPTCRRASTPCAGGIRSGPCGPSGGVPRRSRSTTERVTASRRQWLTTVGVG